MKRYRKLNKGPIVIASHNPGKITEISVLLKNYSTKVIPANTIDIIEPEETGLTFSENAAIKALTAAEASGLPALADDSGLSVSALNGKPGVRSARWAGPERDFTVAMKKLLKLIEGKGDRAAHFPCALCLAWPDRHQEIFLGNVFGTLTSKLIGDKGFGYDAIFQPEGFNITFAEMDPAKKHSISHRAVAFEKLASACLR